MNISRDINNDHHEKQAIEQEPPCIGLVGGHGVHIPTRWSVGAKTSYHLLPGRADSGHGEEIRAQGLGL